MSLRIDGKDYEIPGETLPPFGKVVLPDLRVFQRGGPGEEPTVFKELKNEPGKTLAAQSLAWEICGYVATEVGIPQ